MKKMLEKGIMKRTLILMIIVFSSVVFVLASEPPGGDKKAFTLKEDLAIGANSGDENLIFSGVADIGLDAAGNIFILDWSNFRIQKFDAAGKFLKRIILKKGQGPEEG